MKEVELKWNVEEELWWLSKEEMLNRFVEVLVKIFKETLWPGKKQIFNITLLITSVVNNSVNFAFFNLVNNII